VHYHLIPGEGAIDFAAVFDALRDINYDGWITIELYPYVDDPDAAARIALERVRSYLTAS
jgi:sugar phosphate isomerase/epimerase